jgi:hypothetical protein
MLDLFLLHRYNGSMNTTTPGIRVIRRSNPSTAPIVVLPVAGPSLGPDLLRQGFKFTPDGIQRVLSEISHRPGFREIHQTVWNCSSYEVKNEKPQTVFEWFHVTSVDSPLMRGHLQSQGEGRSVFLYQSKNIGKNPAYVIRLDRKTWKIGIDLFGRDSTKELTIFDGKTIIFSDWSKTPEDEKLLSDAMVLVAYGLLRDPKLLNWMFAGVYGDEYLHL